MHIPNHIDNILYRSVHNRIRACLCITMYTACEKGEGEGGGRLHALQHAPAVVLVALRALRRAAGRSGRRPGLRALGGRRVGRPCAPGSARSIAAFERRERLEPRTGGSDLDLKALDFPQGESLLAQTATLRSETLTLDLWTLDMQPNDRIRNKRAPDTGTAGCEIVSPQGLSAIHSRNWLRPKGAS